MSHHWTPIEPVLTYAALVWRNCTKFVLHKFQVIQNSTLKIIVDILWYIRNTTVDGDLDIETLDDHIKERTKKTYQKAETHHNHVIRKTASQLQPLDINGRSWWSMKLTTAPRSSSNKTKHLLGPYEDHNIIIWKKSNL